MADNSSLSFNNNDKITTYTATNSYKEGGDGILNVLNRELGGSSALLPIDITQYGGLGDGVTDNYPAFLAAYAAGGTVDITSRIANPSIAGVGNGNGIASGWNSWIDPNVSNGYQSFENGVQKLNVTSSTGVGSVGVYTDMTVNPGDIINFDFDVNAVVLSGGFQHWLEIHNANGGILGSGIVTFQFSGTTNGWVTHANNQITVPAGTTNIRIFLMARAQAAGDTGYSYVRNIVARLTRSNATRAVKFPQNALGNATYYFGTSPSLDNKVIDADAGVILSFPSMNAVSTKKVTFLNPVTIYARDRNNNGGQLPNNFSQMINKSFIENPQDVGIKSLSLIPDASVSKNVYNASGAAITTLAATFDNTSLLYNASSLAENLTNIITTEFSFTTKNMYSGVFSFAATETNANVALGITASLDNNNIFLYYLKPDKTVGKGWRTTSAGWTSVNYQKYKTRFTDAYGMTNGVLFSCRPLANNMLEIYINGVQVDTVTVPFAYTKIGFGMIQVSQTGAGVKNVSWGKFVTGAAPRVNFGDILSIISFGDSITYGEGSISYADYLPSLLEGQRGINSCTVNNQGLSGETVNQQKTVMAGIDVSTYDVVTILIGTNDISAQTNTTNFQSDLQAMITQAQTAGVPVVLAAPPIAISSTLTGTGYTANTNYDKGAVYRAICMQLAASNTGVYYADIVSEMGRIGTDNWSKVIRDNLHPNTVGQLAMARCFARSIIAAITNE